MTNSVGSSPQDFICVCVFLCVHDKSSNVELRNYVISSNVGLRNYVISRQKFIKYTPLNPLGWGGSIFLGESQSRIYPHMRAKFGRGPTVVSKKEGFMIMKLLQVCQVQYCQQCVNF